MFWAVGVPWPGQEIVLPPRPSCPSGLPDSIVSGRARGTWRFPGQGADLRHRSDLSRCSDSARSVTHCATRAPRFHLTRGFPLLRFTLCVGGRCCRWSSFALFVSEAAPCLCACLEGRACPVGRKPPSVASASRGCILGLSLPCLLAPPESSSARSVVCCFSGSTTGSVASLLTSRGRVSLVAARSPISVDGRLGGRNGPSKAFSAGACWVTRGFPPRCSFLQSWLILCPWLTFT